MKWLWGWSLQLGGAGDHREEYWVAELGFKEAGSFYASQEEKVAGPRVAVPGVGGPGVIGCLSWAWRREARSSDGRSQETMLMALSVHCITLFCFGNFVV